MSNIQKAIKDINNFESFYFKKCFLGTKSSILVPLEEFVCCGSKAHGKQINTVFHIDIITLHKVAVFTFLLKLLGNMP